MISGESEEAVISKIETLDSSYDEVNIKIFGYISCMEVKNTQKLVK
jgi:hypothetical protein